MKNSTVVEEEKFNQDHFRSLAQSLGNFKKDLARLTKDIDSKSLFTLCKEKTGGWPEFSRINGIENILKRVQRVSSIFHSNGRININSKHIENYALCLAHLGHLKRAKQLFDAIDDRWKTIVIKPEDISDLAPESFYKAISRRPKSLLFLYPLKRGLIYQSELMADRPGQLGYEGFYQYALVCQKLGYEKRAQELLEEIVTRISPDCPPDRLTCIRVEAIENLMAMGINYVGEIALSEELKKAKFHRY